MGWRFRKSFKVMPGVRLNVSRRGLSATLGASPFSVGIGSAGAFANVTLPGTGISYRHRLGGSADIPPGSEQPAEPPPSPRPDASPIAPSLVPSGTEIRSRSTESITSESLRHLRELLQDAHFERSKITEELGLAERETVTAEERHRSWEGGFLLKRLMPARFRERAEAAEIARAKRDELREQLRLTQIATEIDIESSQAELYFRMRDCFVDLTGCRFIWDTLTESAVNQKVKRSAASREIAREAVTFLTSRSEIIDWDQKVPRLVNRNGGDLFLYPGFVLYGTSREAFALVDFRDIKVEFEATGFLEEERVPDDSRVINRVWAKVNKDGSPDRRFRDNYQIPVVEYGRLRLKSSAGLNEEYQFSNFELSRRFAQSWLEFRLSFDD
jgi:hypothetical protein